jgi:hypothetical protein
MNEKALEILSDFCDALEAAAVNVKRQIAELTGAKEQKSQKEPTAAVKEETFTNLKFEEQQGAKIGSYQVAYEKTNIPEKFSVALNILTKSNALINTRYYGEGYEFTYWTYQGKIYRQKLKPKT